MKVTTAALMHAALPAQNLSTIDTHGMVVVYLSKHLAQSLHPHCEAIWPLSVKAHVCVLANCWTDLSAHCVRVEELVLCHYRH